MVLSRKSDEIADQFENQIWLQRCRCIETSPPFIAVTKKLKCRRDVRLNVNTVCSFTRITAIGHLKTILINCGIYSTFYVQDKVIIRFGAVSNRIAHRQAQIHRTGARKVITWQNCSRKAKNVIYANTIIVWTRSFYPETLTEPN